MPKNKRISSKTSPEERTRIKYDRQNTLLRHALGMEADPDFWETKPYRRTLWRKAEPPTNFAIPVLYPYEILVPFSHVPVGRLMRYADGNGCEWVAIKDDLARIVRVHHWLQDRTDEYLRCVPEYPVAVTLQGFRPVPGKSWIIYQAGSEWLANQLADYITKLPNSNKT